MGYELRMKDYELRITGLPHRRIAKFLNFTRFSRLFHRFPRFCALFTVVRKKQLYGPRILDPDWLPHYFRHSMKASMASSEE